MELYRLEEEEKLPFLVEREEDSETSEEDVLLDVLKLVWYCLLLKGGNYL